MKKILLIIFAIATSSTSNIYSQLQSNYEYKDVENYAEFEKQIFAFWDYVENQIVLLEDKSTDANIKDSVRFDLGVNSNRWLYNYDNTNKEQTQKQHDFLHSYVENRLKRIKERTGLAIEPTNLSGFIDYLAGLRSKEEAEKMALHIGMYRPAETADEYLNDLEEFIEKHFDTELLFSVDEMYPYELYVFRHNFDTFSPRFTKEQKERYEMLYEKFGEKNEAWDKKQLLDYTYDFKVAKNIDLFEIQLVDFWKYIDAKVTILEDEDVEQSIKDSIQFDLAVDYAKWSHSWTTIKETATQKQRDQVEGFVDTKLEEMARKVENNLISKSSFHTYLSEGMSKELEAEIPLLISKYPPANTADKYLENLEKFIEKDFNVDMVLSVENRFPYELIVFKHDEDRFSPQFNRGQRKRQEKLTKNLEKKKMEWNKRDGLRWKEMKVDTTIQ